MKVFQFVILLPRIVKQSILLLADSVLLITALWLSFSLRLGEIFKLSSEQLSMTNGTGLAWLFVAVPMIAIPIFVRYGLYRAIIRYLGMRAIWSVVQAVALYSVLWGLLVLLSGVPGVPRSVILINAMAALLAIGGVRILARWLFSQQVVAESGVGQGVTQTRCVIFGAGDAGRQLALGLAHTREYILTGFVDDSPELQGRDLMGVPILSLEHLEPFVQKNRVTDLLLAIPSISRKERNHILERLRPIPVRTRTLPGLVDLAQGRVNLSDLQELDVGDLLGRDIAEPDEELLKSQVSNQTVLVTGAGGSIGSEISRQILKRRPKVLLLLELSEYALYSIHQELQRLSAKLEGDGEPFLLPRVIPLLGSVQDERRLTELMQVWRPDVIYHAAAYKHVPMVEHNLAEGIKNNVFGTLAVAKVAIEQGVSNFVLISTDKAVHPTNGMGASKRVAEMVLQALVAESSPVFDTLGEPLSQVERKTHLSMVRFGNVLDSSGSVVPLFRKQIADGGPITLTHPDITRYFMTIPEASQLVMQAGVLGSRFKEQGSSGEVQGGREVDAAAVFVLDMGEPVKIMELARRMVELSGMRVKEESFPHGDIEIEITGLRPGEKLYEELLIGDNPQPTEHPRILKAHEEFIPWDELQPHLHTLQIAVDNDDVEIIRSLLQKLVKGYQPDDKVVDWVYMEGHSERRN